jgi:hypothetical protein
MKSHFQRSIGAIHRYLNIQLDGEQKTLIFLWNFQIWPISYSVCHWQAFWQSVLKHSSLDREQDTEVIIFLRNFPICPIS